MKPCLNIIPRWKTWIIIHFYNICRCSILLLTLYNLEWSPRLWRLKMKSHRTTNELGSLCCSEESHVGKRAYKAFFVGGAALKLRKLRFSILLNEPGAKLQPCSSFRTDNPSPRSLHSETAPAGAETPVGCHPGWASGETFQDKVRCICMDVPFLQTEIRRHLLSGRNLFSFRQ